MPRLLGKLFFGAFLFWFVCKFNDGLGTSSAQEFNFSPVPLVLFIGFFVTGAPVTKFFVLN